MSTESVSAPVGLVTGADKGIGLERAGRLAGAGYRVYLTAQQRARRGCCREGRRAVRGTGRDLRRVGLSRRRLRRAGRGQLDVLVSNVGITGPVRDPHDFTADASPKRSHFSPAAKAA
jgi:NAD(P)-dependent dehydrogenase (short-subunit alcohol dehydrogenase family)